MNLDLSNLRLLYPVLHSVPDQRLLGDLSRLTPIEVPARTVLFREGEACLGFPLILSGGVRVIRSSSEGKTLELYRIGEGEICLVSAGCVFGQHLLTAQGESVSPTQLLMVDRDTLLAWTEFRDFRAFVLGTMADRIADLMTLVEAIAFHRLDERLAGVLLGRGTTIHETHQQLADELGTAREIVSRLLRRFEVAGVVRLGRERVEIVDAAGLRSIAAGKDV